ncbi:ATP-dependent protease subunit HslV [Entomospira nematocerorum]|uniref:ATP-dependent protease subunit HslV n=1 Tax=Entomospira nematocerorum TaxID=2719987 RepID=A0A968KUT4_9SPIO|nr:ATP-dependent protease subunit HslV [Entomospira nematocera]NIZ46533.1 ATP-dependent protease subunit HslV [Entomospira nematocera]WDI33668.1 ATP-dependent protease subunit HslV [Entomospira nematocera]
MEHSMKATTILVVRKNGKVAMAGDGQVTFGQSVVMKATAKKVRKLFDGKVLCGFAGSTADAFTLEELFESKMKERGFDITRAAIEVAKEWRSDRRLRKLEAMLLVADKEHTLLISGSGDVIEPEHDTMAIGSGGNFAYSAALAYLDGSSLSAAEIARKSLQVAANLCVFTNHNIIVEELV